MCSVNCGAIYLHLAKSVNASSACMVISNECEEWRDKVC